MKTKRKAAIGIALLIVICITAFCFAYITAEASTGIMHQDSEGRIFASDTGYIKINGKTYYAHCSKSRMYEKYELLTNGYRVRNNKLYYFGADGAMVTKKTRRDKSTRFLDFNRDGSVHCIYPSGRVEPYERYNANHRLYQVRKHGKWKDVGQQVWPYGLIDHQW